LRLLGKVWREREFVVEPDLKHGWEKVDVGKMVPTSWCT
jgi:hypothetical protein